MSLAEGEKEAADAAAAAALRVLPDLLGSTLVTANGAVSSQLGAKVIALYFSAHWCPPCRRFTPELAAAYRELQRQGKSFEVVFVSSDRSAAEFNAYLAAMPWKAIPYEDEERRSMVGSKFRVWALPTLILIRPDGSIITRNGRRIVNMLDRYPWDDLSDGVCSGCNII